LLLAELVEEREAQLHLMVAVAVLEAFVLELLLP
jgi:hypothetical protein